MNLTAALFLFLPCHLVCFNTPDTIQQQCLSPACKIAYISTELLCTYHNEIDKSNQMLVQALKWSCQLLVILKYHKLV